MQPNNQIYKNVDGHVGPICNNCGGYGFTNLITGGAGGCHRCDQTGIEPINTRDLAAKVDKLTELVTKLVEKN